MVIQVSATIGGTLYRDFPDMSVKKRISETNASSTFTIQLDNRDGKYSNTFNIANEVIIKAEDDVNPPTQTILVGRISDISFDSSPNWETVTLTGKDYTAVLQDFTVEPEVYNNTEVSVIVLDIMTKYSTGITTTNVQVTSKTLIRQVFLQKNVYDALKELAEYAGYYFFVDNNKDLNFVPQGTVDSNLTFDNTNTLNADFEKTDDELANKIYVYGNRILTAQHDVLTSNGGSVFTLTYKPHNTTVTISGTRVLSGGIFEMAGDESNAWQYLVDFDNRNIIFTSGTLAGNNLITSGGSFLMDYFRDVPIIKTAEEPSSELAYGIRTKTIQSDDIRDPRQAVNIALNQLDQFSEPVFEGNLSLQSVLNVTPGQLVTLNLPNQNLNSIKYSILEANYNFNKETIQAEQVLKVKVSSKRRDILDTLKQIILDLKKQQSSQFSTDDVITRIQTSIGSITPQVKLWSIYTRSLGESFIFGHLVNGKIGSPAVAVNGSQITLGDHRGGSVLQISGVG